MNLQRTGQLLLAFHQVENFLRCDGMAFREAPTEHIIDRVQAFVLGGMQNFQILFDRRFLVVSGHELIIGHAKVSRGIEVMDVFVIDKGPRLSHQGVDHMPKVDVLLALPEQPRQAFQTFAVIPELQVVLMDDHIQVQADVLAAHRIQVAFDPEHAIRFHPHRDTGRRNQPLGGQGPEGRHFLGKDKGL